MTNKITIKNSVKIIDDEYVAKRKKQSSLTTYNYLSSRSFDYFPEVINVDDEYIYYKYITDVLEPQEQKIIDLVVLLALLHSKTTFYKEVDIDYYKEMYESINNQIDETYAYYNNLIDNIDGNVFMSPANYLIARNITLIYDSLNYSREYIHKWYGMIEDKRKVRVVTIHNNLKLEHYLKSDKPYLISWDNSSIDMPIYDLISLYKNNYLDFEFDNIFKLYLDKFPLSNEEMCLFLTLISLPDKIKYQNSEYETILEVRRIVDYLYKTKELRKKYRVTQKADETKKQNK